MSDVNELLIYTNLSDESLLQCIKSKLKYEDSISLDYYLIETDCDVKTIDYTVCINRLRNIFDIEKFYDDLLNIGKIRNKIIHFGINKSIDFHTVLCA